MARTFTTIVLALAASFSLLPTGNSQTQSAPLTAAQQEFVDDALARFAGQGLDLPETNFVFHENLLPCHGHKGLYRASTRTLEMCSMDSVTMLHELAHAWANENLSEEFKAEFVESRDLDSWNDHDHPWDRRGTEHVAETLAWALSEDPHHVEWMETLPDGSSQTTYVILSLGVDVVSLLHNFSEITGGEPEFRHVDEWMIEDDSSDLASPELARLNG